MSDEPIARKALRAAERGARADVSGLIAAVPGLLREADLRRGGASRASPSVLTFATWALPRLAAATLVAVLAATTLVMWDRGPATMSATFESVVLGGDVDGAADAILGALLDQEGSDG